MLIWVLRGGARRVMLSAAFVMSLVNVLRSSLVSGLLLAALAALRPRRERRAGGRSSACSAAAPKDELTANEIVIKLRGNETDIRRCFFANPNARGSLSLSWNVNDAGRIEHLKRERSTLTDARIEQCLGEKLYDVRFDPRERPAHARWTSCFAWSSQSKIARAASKNRASASATVPRTPIAAWSSKKARPAVWT